MKISELVKKTNVSKETIHYYIREGALPKPKKSTKNTADYDEDIVSQIQLIKDLQDNYYLPLSEIKKIIKNQKKLSPSDKIKFQFLIKSRKPIDQISFDSVTGRDNFLKATGMSEHWLLKMEEWEIITPEKVDDRLYYSADNVTIGKLLVDMDRLGYGPKDGYPPDNLKIYMDFIKNVLLKKHLEFLNEHPHLLESPEYHEKGIKLMEELGLFFYHVFRRTATAEVLKLLDSLYKKNK
ncbi:MAG TPA: MerR family transcriptional regulator [Smithella sp.]|nr:MerR family transcriptional regulator [Smithella sp.]